MISETGSVVELKGKQIAVILCQKSSFCRHCISMQKCQVGEDNRTMLVEALNGIGAQVGDKVRIETSTRSFLESSFLLYMVPLLSLIAGGVCGQVIGERMQNGLNPDLLSALLGTAFLIGSFLVIRVGSRALPREDYIPKITAILTENDSLITDLPNGH